MKFEEFQEQIKQLQAMYDKILNGVNLTYPLDQQNTPNRS